MAISVGTEFRASRVNRDVIVCGTLGTLGEDRGAKEERVTTQDSVVLAYYMSVTVKTDRFVSRLPFADTRRSLE